MRRLELDILFWSTRAAILLLLPLYISDVYVYEEYAQKLIRDGLLPYRSWSFEYPPLALPLIAFPALVQKMLGLPGTEYFRVIFGLLLLPFDFFLFRAFRNLPPFPGAAFAYVLFTCFMGLLLYDRFDITVGFLLVYPFLTRDSIRDWRFVVAWGLGGALKLVPLALAPLPVFFWPGPRAKRIFAYGAAISLPLAMACGAAAWLAGGNISFLAHHSGRGVQVESLLGSLAMAAQAFFHLLNLSVDNNFGAQHLGNIKGIVPASRVLFFGSLVLSYFFLWWEKGKRDLLSSCWILISGFVTFGYVLSPQFLLWLIPLGLYAAGTIRPERRSVWLAIFGLAVALTGVHFRFYWSYINLNHLSVAAVLARNGLLVLLWWLSWQWMRGPKKDFSLNI